MPLERVVLRPNLFLQGLLAFAGQIADTGRFGAPIGDAAVSAVDVRDIGEVAAAALVEPGHAGATYTLTGPRAVTHHEVAAALAAATGRPVAFDDVTPTSFADALRAHLPAWQLEGLVEDYAHLRARRGGRRRPGGRAGHRASGPRSRRLRVRARRGVRPGVRPGVHPGARPRRAGNRDHPVT